MTLWCIFRSPLIFGGDLTQLGAFTRSLLTNSEVLAVNQASANNRPVLAQGGIAWTATALGEGLVSYVALFNLLEESATITVLRFSCARATTY
jgi:hypothetical protein